MSIESIEPRRTHLDLHDGSVSYLEWRDDALPPLHFAHANGFNAETYKSLLGPLAERFWIRASDARGHGFSTLKADPGDHDTWHVYSDDLIHVLEAFAEEAGRPVLLAGHSMGGTASVMAAAERPDLVAGLVLADPVLFSRWQRRLASVLAALGLAPKRFDLAAAAERRRPHFPDREAAIAAYRGRGAFASWPGEMVRDYVMGGTLDDDEGGVVLACSPDWEAANFRAHGHNSFAAIRKLKRPFIVLRAEAGSTTMPPAPRHLERAAKRLPGSALRVVPGTSHFLPMENPKDVRDALAELGGRLHLWS